MSKFFKLLLIVLLVSAHSGAARSLSADLPGSDVASSSHLQMALVVKSDTDATRDCCGDGGQERPGQEPECAMDCSLLMPVETITMHALPYRPLSRASPSFPGKPTARLQRPPIAV